MTFDPGKWLTPELEEALRNTALPTFSVPLEQPLTVRKAAGYLPVSDELLHPERYPWPPVTRRTRFRWWRRDMRERVTLAWDVLRHGHDCGDYL